jgi:hypothetical protein
MFMTEGLSSLRSKFDADMKLACTSNAFARAFDRGDMTQLEFLDSAARSMECDGVVLDVRHFPRTDDDYLAQIKKAATDLNLSIAALAAPALPLPREELLDVLAFARAVGAPLVAVRLALETALARGELLASVSHASSAAKQANVTLALRNAPGTFAATVPDCKRVLKETDSAWLRLGPEPALFEAARDATELLSKSVLLWLERSRGTLDGWEGFGGFTVLDDRDGGASTQEIREIVRRLRREEAKRSLNRA